MLESILADILNRYLKPYVKKLDTSQLRLGIWKGDVCLENLELKEDIFTDLGVPVIIKTSHIGKITLKIPWKNLTKESIIVTVEDIFVIAGPVTDTVYDEKKEKERKWEKKQAKLKDIEETRKKQESQKEEKDSFVEKLITHIVKNLLVKVHSIHIRYEDTITNPGHPMAVGVTLDSIEMQTTDDAYKPCVIKEATTLIHKLIQMDCLAFYWMVDTPPLANLQADVMKNKMKALIAREGQGSTGAIYILRPLTATARMKLNTKPNYNNNNDSKVLVDVTNDVMEVMFIRAQYCSLLDTMESVDRAFVQHRYHKYRDKLNSSKTNHPRVWWQYAITCVLEEQVKRKLKMWSWSHMIKTRKMCKLYTEKYLDKITSFTTSSSLVKELEAMEQEMDLFIILLCRQQAVNQKRHKAIRKMAQKTVKEEAKAEKLQQKQQQQQLKQIEKQQQQQLKQQQKQQQIPSQAPPAETEKKSTGFFSRLKNRLKHGDHPSGEEERKKQTESTVAPPAQDTERSAKETKSLSREEVTKQQAVSPTKETKKAAKEIEKENITAEQLAIERQKLFEAIGYSEGSPKEEYPREYVAEHIKLKLNLLTVALVDERKSKKIGYMETTGITASVRHRPADNGVTVHASVGGITVLGVAQESHDTTIVSTPETKEKTGESSPLIVVQFDVNPLGMSTDFMLFASLNPLEIIYDSETIDSIINMFLIQKVIHFQELAAATIATVDQLQTQTRVRLQYVLKKRKLMDITLSLKSPYIVLPTGGTYNNSASSVIVVDLGGLDITSSSKEFVGSNKNRDVEDYYDTFNISLSTVQVLVAKPGEDWRYARAEADVTSSRLHILKPAGMKLVIQRSILQQDAFLPSLKVEGDFSSFEVFISDARLKELMKILLSIQLPPPSLKNATKFIETNRDTLLLTATENLDRVIEEDSDSSLSADDQSLPCSPTEVENEPRPSLTAVSQSASTVFTQLSLNINVKEVSLELDQEEESGDSKKSIVKPLLHLKITGIMANVKDRSWDTSAAISVTDIVIFDHITLDSGNAPVKLLEADTLSSGKVLSLDAVLLNATRKELAAKLSSGESTINCNMSLLQVNVHENTMVELSRVAFLLAPLLLEIPRREAKEHPVVHDTGAGLHAKLTSSPAIINLKMNMQASFKGLKINVSDSKGPFISAEILALQVAGLFSSSKKEITASMDGLVVTDLCGVSSCAKVISVSGDEKMLEFKAMLTSPPSNDSDSNQSELELSLEVQQLKIYFIMQLFSQFLMMISNLHFDPTFVNAIRERSQASKSKKEIKVTSSVPVGSTAAKIRAKLNLHFHAPIITLPIVGSSSALRFDLGDFVVTTTDSRVVTLPNGFEYVQETIRIKSDGTRADRVSSDDSSSCEMLPVMKFDVNVVRSLLENPVDVPLLDVQLKLHFVKVHLCSKEIVALLLLVSSFDELTQIGKDISHSAVGSGEAKPTNVDVLPVTAVDNVPSDHTVPTGNALVAKVRADLDVLQLEVTPLCSAEIKSISTTAIIDNVKTEVFTSVKTMTVFDLAMEDEKITSYLEKSKSFAELKVTVYQTAHEMIYSQDVLLPIKMDVDVNVSSFHLILNMGFISRSIEFGETVAVDKKVLEKLARVAQNAAVVLPDQLGRHSVFVCAPVIYLSLPKATHGQALVLNCGQLKINNSYLKLEGEVKSETDTVKKPAYINRYSFSLTQLTITRSIVSFYEDSIKTKAQRTLLQPIQFTVNLSNSLSSDVTSVPTTSIEANLGNVKVSYGDEDVKSIVNFVATIIGNFKSKTDSELTTEKSLSVQTSIVDRVATDQQKKSATATTTTTTAVADILAFNAVLESFCISVYTDEPPLSPKLNVAALPSSNALMIVNVTNLSVTGSIAADGHNKASAELGDVEIIDAREKSSNEMTRKLLQSFQADSTKSSSVETSGPLVKVTLNSSRDNHEDYVTCEGKQILVLLNVDFILSIQAYANSIYGNILNPEKNELVHNAMQYLKNTGQRQHNTAIIELAESTETVESKRGFKIQGVMEKFSIALLDPEQSIEQVVLLQTNMFSNVSKDSNKGQTQLSLRLDDLTITSSHLLKLSSPTSYFLLPALLNITCTLNMKGTAITKLDLWVDVDCITVNISPPIVGLLVDVVSAVVPKKKEAVKEDEQLPLDIWNKHEWSPSVWYSLPVMLNRARDTTDSSVDAPERNEAVVVEVKRFEVNVSRGHGPVNAELALNGNVYVEVNDITGALQAHATLQMEASYYNDHHSLWEPLIEPLEDVNGKHGLWTGVVKVKRNLSDDDIDWMRTSVASLSSLSSLADPSARYKVTLSAEKPLQVTLSKKSLSLIKDTAEVYTANASRDAVTHKKPTHEFSTSTSAFTVKNKLGPGIVMFIQPGETLKFLQDQKFVKFGYGEMVDLAYAYGQDRFNRESKSVLLRQPKKKEVQHCIDIKIAMYDPLKNVSLAVPGVFYYTISRKNPKTDAIDKASIVVEIIFSDTKKSVFIRSPLQIQNHTDLPIDLVIQSVQKPHVIPANSYHSIPVDKLNEPIILKPSGKNLDTSVMLHWMSTESSSVVKCISHDVPTQSPYYLKVVKETEDYANSDVVINDDSPHHVFHLYPPAVLCNLLPVPVVVMNEVVGEGKDVTLLRLNPQESESLTITINNGHQSGHGSFRVSDDMKEFTRFNFGEGKQATELSVHREDLAYHKLSLYASYWMVNKTNLTLEYQDFESKKKTIHESDQEIMCYSCDQNNQKRKVQFSARLGDNRHTEWSAVISLNAAGTRGYARLKCGNVIHDLGIKIQLSRFTLTKVVTVSPYYLIINDTQHYIKCVMGDNSTVEVSSNSAKALWPKTTDPFMHIIVQGYTSKIFQYRTSNNNKDAIVENVLLKMGHDVVAIMVEFNITQNAHLITFCPYYAGAMPARIVNACDSFSIRIRQNTMSAKEQLILAPHETIMYTWDDPAGTRSLWWSVVGNMEKCNKPISLTKNSDGSFKLPSGFRAATSIAQVQDLSWTVAAEETDDGFTEISSEASLMASSSSTRTSSVSSSTSGYWVSFLDHLQRVVMFTQDRDMVDCAKAGEETGLPILDLTLSLKNIGVSLVNNSKKKEIAYIGITQSSVIWEVKKKKNKWITLNNEIISILEEEYNKNPKTANIEKGKLHADLSIMQIHSPYKGQLRRTYYDGLSMHFKLNEKRIELGAKLGHMQVDNQLPFSVYPQVLYPLPPPPTVASTCEPKPFIEASVVIRRSDKVSMAHIQYAGLLIQEMAVNVDLGFLLSVISFFTLRNSQSHLGGYVVPQKKEALVPLKDFSSSSGKDITVSRYFFTLIHFSPIKIRLSFNIRSYGKNLDPEEDTVAKQALNLLLHSLGVVLTSVQETEMKYAYLHLEYQQVTVNKLKDMVVKHYTNQTLYQIYSLIFGLDMLGNPVSLVKGVAGGAIDLFYEPYKGVVLGGDEFLQGLGIGLKSFLGGTVGGIAGAGAKVTGAVGDVFAKLTFDEQFIDRRQQQKVAPPKLGSKLGGFAKNVFQGVTGVVTQPVKGAKQEGVLGLAKGMGKGVVGLVMRPTGGLIDLASGSLDTVRRGTSLNNVEVFQMRAPRFIDREGILTPYSAKKAQGNALLLALENGEYANTDYYITHMDISSNPLCVLLITDMRVLVVQKSKILEAFGYRWSINWEVIHSKVKGIQLNGFVLEAIYKSKRSGFDKLQFKYSQRYQLPNDDKVAKEAIELINATVEYNL